MSKDDVRHLAELWNNVDKLTTDPPINGFIKVEDYNEIKNYSKQLADKRDTRFVFRDLMRICEYWGAQYPIHRIRERTSYLKGTVRYFYKQGYRLVKGTPNCNIARGFALSLAGKLFEIVYDDALESNSLNRPRPKRADVYIKDDISESK